MRWLGIWIPLALALSLDHWVHPGDLDLPSSPARSRPSFNPASVGQSSGSSWRSLGRHVDVKTEGPRGTSVEDETKDMRPKDSCTSDFD